MLPTAKATRTMRQDSFFILVTKNFGAGMPAHTQWKLVSLYAIATGLRHIKLHSMMMLALGDWSEACQRPCQTGPSAGSDMYQHPKAQQAALTCMSGCADANASLSETSDFWRDGEGMLSSGCGATALAVSPPAFVTASQDCSHCVC